MTSRRNQLLKKLVGTAIGEDEKKLYQLTIERICADMCDYYFKFYHNEGPGAMVYVPEHEDEKKSMFYLTVDNLITAVDDLNKRDMEGAADVMKQAITRAEKLDYLIVETTGLADPLPVAMTFAAGDLREKVRLDSIITVIDGENFDFEMNNTSVAYSQILYGDILLLNKTDLVNEKQLKKIEEFINKIKKEPRILRSTNSEVSLHTIMSVGLFETDTFEFEKNKNNIEQNSNDHSSHSHDHSSHSHDLINNIEGFTSVSYETFEPFSLRKFQYFLDNQISKNVFRAKGILWFMEIERKHIFHLSGKRFSLDDEEWTKEKSNKIVLIGKNLDHQTIKNQLSSCRFNSD